MSRQQACGAPANAAPDHHGLLPVAPPGGVPRFNCRLSRQIFASGKCLWSQTLLSVCASCATQDLIWKTGFGPTNPSLINGTGELRNKRGSMPQYQCRFGPHDVGTWRWMAKSASNRTADCHKDAKCNVR